MTDAPRQQCSKGRATQSRAGAASASGTAFRCRRKARSGLLHFLAPSVSLSRASSAIERSRSSGRSQTGIYRQTSWQLDSASPSVRCGQTIVHQRGGQPGAARAASARARAWVSRGRIGHGPVVWNIDLIACCRTNWRKSINCWCRINGDPWAEWERARRNRRHPARR